MKPIAFFSDTHMLPGLHSTLLSLLISLKKYEVNETIVYLFLDGVEGNEKIKLVETCKDYSKICEIRILDYSPKLMFGVNSLHGNFTAYGRIELASLLKDFDKCLYLDCDLLVNRNVDEIFDFFDGEHVLFVDGVGKRKFSLDNKLFEAAKLDLEGSCFNSGVMGIDLSLWRTRNIDKLCEEVSLKYSGNFKSADQALLNVVLHDSFKPIGEEFNTALLPSSPKIENLENRIYHFVGSPKPWDPLGNIASNHYGIWKEVYSKTSISNKSYLRYSTIKRSLRIARQTMKALFRKINK